MNIARLGAASAAAGIVVLCAAGPAFATGASPAPSAGLQTQETPTPAPKAPGTQPSADVNPKFFSGGDTLTFTVKNCPVHPTLTDVNNLFLKDNPFVKTGDMAYAAKEVVRKDLVAGKEYRVVVKCGNWIDTFSTKPRTHPSPTPSGVPSGAPQTGDGSSNGGGNTGLMAAGAGVVLAGLAGGGYLVARRRSSAGA